jgi:hypothetical protein
MIFILERKGNYSVVSYGEYSAGRYLKVVFSGPVPIAFVDHDKNGGSALRVLTSAQLSSSSPRVRKEHLARFVADHGQVYNWSSGGYADFAPTPDNIASISTFISVLNQAVAEALTAENKMTVAHAEHWRNS